MRKEDLISDIIYLLMAGIVLLVGFLVIQPAIVVETTSPYLTI